MLNLLQNNWNLFINTLHVIIINSCVNYMESFLIRMSTCDKYKLLHIL